MASSFRPKVTVYYHPLDAACEAVRQVLERVRPFEDFILDEVDIDQDPLAHKRYHDQIPVVALNGVVTFQGRLNEDQFIRRLRDTRQAMRREEEDRQLQARGLPPRRRIGRG